MSPSDETQLKKQLRTQLFDDRRHLAPSERERANRQIASHCRKLIDALGITRLAAYVPVSTEPGGPSFLEEICRDSLEILLPRCAPERQLEWAAYEGPESLEPAGYGLLEPTGSAISGDALSSCGLIIVPALAVTPRGFRLGKGGGYYDRALSKVPAEIPAVAVVFNREVRDDIPLAAHDIPCSLILTEEGIQSVD